MTRPDQEGGCCEIAGEAETFGHWFRRPMRCVEADRRFAVPRSRNEFRFEGMYTDPGASR